jgi:hypothetical protein
MRPEIARYADSANFTQQTGELNNVLNEAGAQLRPLFKVDNKMRSVIETPHASYGVSTFSFLTSDLDLDEMSHFHFVNAPEERFAPSTTPGYPCLTRIADYIAIRCCC